MSLTIPQIDNRGYQDLVNDALARIPVHTPEWTNFNDSDPGVTLIQLWAFLTENLLYRSNQIPERNRHKFLSLLGVPLAPGSAARGLVVFSDARPVAGPTEILQPLTLERNLELSAGEVRFRSTVGLDLLPLEAQVFYKRSLTNPDQELVAYYQQLYRSFGLSGALPDIELYETTALEPPGATLGRPGLDLASQAVVGRSLWVALLARASDLDRTSPKTLADSRERVRRAIGGKTLSLALVPGLSQADLALTPSGTATAQLASLLSYELPNGQLTEDRRPNYRACDVQTIGDILSEPVLVQVPLPPAEQLLLWDALGPLEPGADDFPPTLEDTSLADRLITWLRIRVSSNTLGSAGESGLRVLWAGINATLVTQRVHVAGERLPDGTGDPDQVVTLNRVPVLPRSVRLIVSYAGTDDEWDAIDDLLAAGSEVPVRDPRLPPGAIPPLLAPSRVFALDPASGDLRFGDGIRGVRPPFGALLRADYDYSQGQAGNVGVGTIKTVPPALANAVKVTNPVPTWGGADAETAAEGEKQIARFLQHRDRLVTVEDFVTITRRTPGVELGRVEVIPTFNPALAPNARGSAPGAVTIMVVPARDPVQPDAPLPDRLFLRTICDYLEPRRLVTTEVFLRGPQYQPIWISVGINVVPNQSIAVVREAVRRALLDFLSPLPVPGKAAADDAADIESRAATGWPLDTPVLRLQLWAVASRVRGVSQVNAVLLARDEVTPTQTDAPLADADEIALRGLELPRVLGIAVTVGAPSALADVRRQTRGVPNPDVPSSDAPTGQIRRLPVPVVPEGCR